MENLFLRVFTVSAAVSFLLLPLLLCRSLMEKKYAPRTRWGLWLAVALVLLIAPWVPKPQAPVVVEAPDYTLTLPAAPARSQTVPGAPKTPEIPTGEKPQPIAPVIGQGQTMAPAQPGSQTKLPQQSNTRPAASGTPQTPEPQPASVSVTALLSAVWLLGLTLVFLGQGCWYLLARRRLLRASTPVTGLERYAAELGLEGKVTFYRCKAVPGPMTLGVWRPAVLLPPGEPAVAALLHELCHVKRHDVAYKLLFLCACALHWFNPLVWLLYRAADWDVEACCDAAVVEGRDSVYKRSYGELLLSAAGEGRNLPFTTSFGGGMEQMKARLAQLFHPGKQSRVLVCGVLALAVVLGSLVACREKKPLKDGLYCATVADVVGCYPVGEADTDGEDYGSIRLSLLEYDETDGPHGKPLGEHVLPLSAELTLRDGYDPGEKGTQNWQERVAEFLEWPMRRNSIPVGAEYLVLETAGGEVTRMFWIDWSQDGALYTNDAYRFTLQLPESWAGNYTIEEQGQEIRFLYQENDKPLLTLHIMSQADDREGWMLLGVNGWCVYAHIPAGEEGTPWGELREEMREQLQSDSGFAWMDAGLAPEEGYTDEHYGFTLRLPRSWAGRYMVEQGNDEYGLFWRFFQRSADGTKGGELFTIDLRNVGKDEGEEPKPDAAKGRGILGVRDRGDYWEVYRITSPTWTSERREGYEEMGDDVDRITPSDFNFITGTPELQPLTENTMPTLVYYDPDREFLLYRTVDTAYLHYGDTLKEFHAARDGGRRVLWRCDVSEDETTVYLSDVLDDSAARDERFYAWDIAARTLRPVDSIPAGVDHMTHVSGEEIYNSGSFPTADLRSNALQTADDTIVALTVRTNLGDGTLPYLCFTWVEPGEYARSRFLTPERIPGPQAYTDPDWGFTLHLPESLEGQYYVERAGNAWLFYDKAQFGMGGGFLMGLWAEDSETFRASGNTSEILGEKGDITYSLSTWPLEDMEGVPTDRRAAYQTMLRDISGLSEDSLDLSGVTRSSGYLWPLPYLDHGSDLLFGEEDNTLRIQAPVGVTVQSVSGGQVVGVTTHPVTGDMTVTIAHPDGRYSEYGHLEYVQLEVGAEVKRSEIIGLAKAEEGRCWLTYRLLTGNDWRTATSVDPWSVEYRTYDFQPVTRDSLTVAGDPVIAEALRKVLYGNATFYNVESGEYSYADALPFSDGVPVKVYRFTQLDLDGDAVPEMVLWLQRGDDIYEGSIVLHYQNGWVHGYPMSYRSLNMLDLKADGTYGWSSGASNWGWGAMDFRTGKTKNISWVEGETYYVDGQSATREAFDRAYDQREAQPDVTWYSLSDVNPGGLDQGEPIPAEDVPLADKPGEPLNPTETVEVYARAWRDTVYVDGKTIWDIMGDDHKERNLLVYGGRVYLPAAALSQWTGAKVDWDQAAGTVDITTGVSQGALEVDSKWNWTTDYAQLAQEAMDGVTALVWPNLQVTLDGGPRNLSAPPLEHRDSLYLPMDLVAELMWRKYYWQIRRPGDPQMGGREEEKLFVFLYTQPTQEQFRAAEDYYAGVRELSARYAQAMEDLAAHRPETLEEFLEKADNICALVKSFGGLKMSSSPVLCQDSGYVFDAAQALSISPVLTPVKEIGGQWAQMAWGQLYDALTAPWRPGGESKNVPANTYDDYQKLLTMLDAAENTLEAIKAN